MSLIKRLPDDEFFALPEAHEVLGRPVNGFGLAPQKEEGMPIYRRDGGDWLMQTTADGVNYRVEFV